MGPPNTAPSPPTEVLYVVAREDLSPGALAAQVAHAAAEAFGHPPVVVVVLAVPDEPALRQLAATMTDRGLNPALVIEDAGSYAQQATTLGLVRPLADRAAIRKVTSALPLLK